MSLLEEKMLEMLTFSERLERFRRSLRMAVSPLYMTALTYKDIIRIAECHPKDGEK